MIIKAFSVVGYPAALFLLTMTNEVKKRECNCETTDYVTLPLSWSGLPDQHRLKYIVQMRWGYRSDTGILWCATWRRPKPSGCTWAVRLSRSIEQMLHGILSLLTPGPTIMDSRGSTINHVGLGPRAVEELFSKLQSEGVKVDSTTLRKIL